MADLLLGVASVSYTVRPVERHLHPYYAGFVQDEMKLTQKLTLTLGIRYNLELPRTEANNQYVFLDLESPSPVASLAPSLPGLRGGVRGRRGPRPADAVGRHQQLEPPAGAGLPAG